MTFKIYTDTGEHITIGALKFAASGYVRPSHGDRIAASNPLGMRSLRKRKGVVRLRLRRVAQPASHASATNPEEAG